MPGWSEYSIILFAYLLGSIPFGLLLSRMAGLGDITKRGSGNIGATNVTRLGGKKLGLLTLFLDAGKGVLAVYLATLFSPGGAVELAAAASVIGHVFPVWLRFKGGKGVATTLAVFTAVSLPLGVLSCMVWLVVFFLTKISSLAAVIAMVTSPVIALILCDTYTVMLAVFLSILVIFRHYDNILRLLKGAENPIKIKK